MNKAESVAVGIFVGILCPLLTFILGWWSTAVLAISQVLPIPDRVIAIAAFTGLGVGLVLDALYWKKWIAHFYDADVRFMVLVYLLCSIMAVASFMGLPLGNLVVGMLAGVYVGRRQHHAGRSAESFPIPARKVSVFTALVTGLEALAIGLLVLGEGIVAELIQQTVGLEKSVITDLVSIGLILLLSLILMVIQFWCTRTAAWFAFGRGGKRVA